MGEMAQTYKIIFQRSQAKRPLGAPRRRWEDNMKYTLETGSVNM